MVSQGVGFDAGKKIKGRKRFMTVDTLGLVLRVLVTSANVGEREGGKKVLKRVKQSGRQVCRLTTIWADGGFDGEPQSAVGDGLLPLDQSRWCCAQNKPKALSYSKNVGWWSALSVGSWGVGD